MGCMILILQMHFQTCMELIKPRWRIHTSITTVEHLTENNLHSSYVPTNTTVDRDSPVPYIQRYRTLHQDSSQVSKETSNVARRTNSRERTLTEKGLAYMIDTATNQPKSALVGHRQICVKFKNLTLSRDLKITEISEFSDTL